MAVPGVLAFSWDVTGPCQTWTIDPLHVRGKQIRYQRKRRVKVTPERPSLPSLSAPISLCQGLQMVEKEIAPLEKHLPEIVSSFSSQSRIPWSTPVGYEGE